MRALGFCLSVEHARWMARKFVSAGLCLCPGKSCLMVLGQKTQSASARPTATSASISATAPCSVARASSSNRKSNQAFHSCRPAAASSSIACRASGGCQFARVAADEATQCDVFFITLKKSERLFSPTTRYNDYAISPLEFHWESQSLTTSAPTKQNSVGSRPAPCMQNACALRRLMGVA
jgi:hypothetical protein